MFKAVNGLLPLYLSNLFITDSDIHYHYTRQHSNLHVIRHNTSVRASGIKIFGVKIWNLFVSVLKTAPSLNIFTNKFTFFIVTNRDILHNFINCHKRYHLLRILYCMFALSST